MKKIWKIKQADNKDLINLPEYPQFLLKLLALRGLNSEEAIYGFLNPDYTKLNDPFLFKDMQTAVERILQAIEKQEKIVIYADYDADALTACAVVYLVLKKLGASIHYYIPDRFSEGYGINEQALRKIKDEGTNLVITVDCGTNAVLESKLAAELGLELIITDHHEITGEIPQAIALINPKNPNDQYPFSYLTGVGVAFKLVQAILSAPRLPLDYARGRSGQPSTIVEGWEKWLLDLVAIGTVADCQSLTLENRILVSFGLKVLAKTRSIGLQALMEVCQLKKEQLDTFSLGFIIAPRLNAAGRIKHAEIAFRLLVSQDYLEANKLAIELNQLNLRRQILTDQLLSEAREQVELIMDKKILIAALSGFAPERLGVVGLVAGKLTEEFSRPVLVLEKGEMFATGSARSINGFDILAALKSGSELLAKFGGHAQAAGLTLPNDNIVKLHQKLLEFADQFLRDEALKPTLKIDAQVESEDLTWENYDLIQKFGPFGVGNPKPRFLMEDLEILDYRLVGATNQHLKMQLKAKGKILEAIAFNRGFTAKDLAIGKKLDVVFEMISNEWNGNKQLQLKIIDLKVNQNEQEVDFVL